MIPPEIPDNEQARLATLYQLNILDTKREERFDRVTRIACKLFGVPIAVLSFMEAERQWMKATQGFNIKQAIRKTSFCGHVVHSGQMLFIADASKDRRFYDNPFVLGDPNIRFYLGYPIKINAYDVGTLCLIDSKPKVINDIDQTIITDLAQMVEQELESLHLSITDELTGLSNRRGFLKIANYLFEMCKRENQIFSLLFFDLDKFKQINDQFGHAEGDKVLKMFSKLLLKHFRSYDLVARLGGDEFCVFCSKLNGADVNKIAQRLRDSLKNINANDYDINFSVGSIQFNKQKHPTLESIIAEADAKMYRNKRNN